VGTDSKGEEHMTDVDYRAMYLKVRDELAEFLSEDEQVSYTGNGTAGRENMTAPTGFLFQLPKREWIGLTDEDRAQ
jgi:hypothetical protein